MTKPITPEMINAWGFLRAWALDVKAEAVATEADRQAAKAVDVLDNSDWMVPIEEQEYEQGQTEAPTGLDPAEWGDTTRADMARHQQEEPTVGLPELKQGEEARSAFSDTHPRAARELGGVIRGNDEEEQ